MVSVQIRLWSSVGWFFKVAIFCHVESSIKKGIIIYVLLPLKLALAVYFKSTNAFTKMAIVAIHRKNNSLRLFTNFYLIQIFIFFNILKIVYS